MPDNTATETSDAVNATAWNLDIQRGLAWTIILTFAFVVNSALARVIWAADVVLVADILKAALAVLFNIVMVILGFYFGSSKSSASKDETQNKMLEKLTPPASPTPPAPAAIMVDPPVTITPVDVFAPPLALTGGGSIKSIDDALTFLGQYLAPDDPVARDAVIRVLKNGGTPAAKAQAFREWAETEGIIA